MSKGLKRPIVLYRAPRGAAPGRALPLARTQMLSSNGSVDCGLVTGADATPDGALVAIRTYECLRF